MYKYKRMSRYILNEVETSHDLILIRLYFILTNLITKTITTILFFNNCNSAGFFSITYNKMKKYIASTLSEQFQHSIVLIGNNCTGSCKFNYHTTTTAQVQLRWQVIRLFRIMSIPTTFRLFLVLTSEQIGRRLPVFTLLLWQRQHIIVVDVVDYR